MTLLGEQIAYWRKNPWPLGEGTVKDVSMGGVKKACGACEMAFDAANAMFGAKYGYRVVASGSHHEMFRRRAPDWLTGPAFQQVAAAAVPRGYEFRGRVLEQTESAAEQERTSGAPRLSSAEHLPRREEA